MYKDYAHIKLRHLRWAVTLNDQREREREREKQFQNLSLFFALYLCIYMSTLLHNKFALISYATCEWPEMYSFQ